MFDVVLKNGFIYDGNGGEPFVADLAISGGKIAEIGSDLEGSTIIDVTDLAVAPGFIDMHSHGDTTFLLDDKCESKILQGVTAEVSGQCGSTIYPCHQALVHNLVSYAPRSQAPYVSCSIVEFMDKVKRDNKKMSTNLIPLIGHGALRAGVMGQEGRDATGSEIVLMRYLYEQEMQAGAWGLSLGLGYAPGIFATQKELNALGEITKKYDGLVASHMRNQGENILEALEEMYTISRHSGCQVHIAHLKRSGKENFGTVNVVTESIENAVAEGIPVSGDMYPYNASSTGITNILPKWSLEGGIEKGAERLATTHKDELMANLEEQFQTQEDGEALFMVSTHGRYPEADGKNIFTLSEELGLSMAETVAKVIAETKGHTACIFFSMAQEDVDFLLRKEWITIGSDGSGYPLNYGEHGGKLHPRNFGTFPRVLALAREQEICSLPVAVKRMTKATADILGMKDRGELAVGKIADITVFDPMTVQDTSTFDEPYQKPEGIVHVLMGGEFAVQDGEQTEKRLGQFILKR